MLCYSAPGAFVAAFIALVLWRARALIETVAHWLFVVLGWVAVAAIATVAAVVLSAAVALVAYVGHRIRRWQQARGACMDCPHPCVGELGSPGGRTALPEPAVRKAGR
jgi:hypothetical protein